MRVKIFNHGAGISLLGAKSKLRILAVVIFVFLFSATVTFMMDLMERYAFTSPVSATFEWIIKFPVAFLINWLIIFFFTTFIWLLSKNKVLATAISSIVAILVSLINYFKLTIRGEPVYPGDVLFPGEATNIVGATKLVVPETIFIFAIIMLAFVVVSHYLELPTIRLRKRLIFALIIIAFSALSFPLYFANTGVQSAIGIEDAIWNQKYNYEKNGFWAAFFMQTKYLVVDKPTGYSQSAAEKLLSKNKTSTTINNTPNVIVIMNESFWDPTRLSNVTFNIDPLADFRQIQKESLYGDLLVEPFGGNTANTEFEVLTGFSMNALPGGVAYQQYVKRQLGTALPALLKAQGYNTEAIHPYQPWFWNRKEVYPMLGIDKFLSVGDFSESDKKGEYVSDQALGDKIISEYEANKSTNKPFFVHAVTMQNHGWYNNNRYGDQQEISAKSDKLDDGTIDQLDIYAQGVKDANDNLARLVAYFKKESQPTVIVFFGDHLPSIGSNYGMYRSAGYIGGESELSNPDYVKLHTNPFLVWSNTSSTGQNLGTINANYLIPSMLKNSGITANSYFSFLSSKMDGAKACNKTVCLTESGKYAEADSGSLADKLNNQAILQYYYLFN